PQAPPLNAPISSKDRFCSRIAKYLDTLDVIVSLVTFAFSAWLRTGTVHMVTRRSGNGYPSGLSNVEFVRLKINVFAPIPMANEIAAAIVNPLCCVRLRKP